MNDLKILSIDDDEEIRYALRAVFEYQGWEALMAADVEEGIALFRRKRPDLVLMDYHLPRINGIEGVRMLRALDAEVPIIVFTIDENQSVADQFIEAGASDFALKPIKAPDIISRIHLHVRLMESAKRKPVEENRSAKGIGAATLELIENCLRQTDDFVSVDYLTEHTGLAYQTTYRYLQYLASLDRVEVNQTYGKVGRPKQSYRLRRE
ncbi:MAG: response regulator [Oscillospiraceae bacterium]